MIDWATAWRLARRGLDWRFSGLRLLVACLMLGAAALSSIGTLTRAIDREIAARGRTALGGDIAFSIAGRAALPAEHAAMARMGTVSGEIKLQAMARSAKGDGSAVPIELKAVDRRWPLYGALALADPQGRRSVGAPEGMNAYVAPALAERLRVQRGDHVRIGEADLVVAGLIADEPDRLGEGFALAPPVIIGSDALGATRLVQYGTLARWIYRVRLPAGAAPQAVADAFRTAFPSSGFEIRTRDKASPGLDTFVRRMGQFLMLVALAALAIAGIGIANAVSGFLEARRGTIATLKILGATSGDVARVLALQIAAASLAGTVAGLAIGLASVPLAARALAGVLPVGTTLVIDPAALTLAAAQCLLIALVAAALPLLRARAFPAMALMRARIAPLPWPGRAALLPMGGGLALLVALAVLPADAPLIALGFLGGAAALFAALALIGWGVTRAAAHIPRPRMLAARLALANLHRPGAQTPALVVALGFALAAFVLIAAVQSSLDATIASRVPERAPDYFVLDVPRDREADFRTAVAGLAPGSAVRTVPSMRGAILAFGPPGQMTRVADMKHIPDDAWALRGDRGLTYAETLPQGNHLTAGAWWPRGYARPPLVSIDDKLAETLHLHLGDRLTIALFGVERSATIASFRHIDWETMGFNYVLVFSPNTLADAPHTLAATIELPPAQKTPAVRRALLAGLVQRLPSSSVIEVGGLLAQIRVLLGEVGTAIMAAAAVAVLAGLAVLAGAIAAERARRQYDTVILRVLGASRAQVLAAIALEYMLLALVTATVALLLGLGAAWGVVVWLFGFAWLPSWPRIALVVALGVVLVLAIAIGGALGVLRTRPAAALRAL